MRLRDLFKAFLRPRLERLERRASIWRYDEHTLILPRRMRESVLSPRPARLSFLKVFRQ